MPLTSAKLGTQYIIDRIDTDDQGLLSFLFTLGCYSGEPITVISRRWGGCTVAIQDSRYSIDTRLAKAIHLT